MDSSERLYGWQKLSQKTRIQMLDDLMGGQTYNNNNNNNNNNERGRLLPEQRIR